MGGQIPQDISPVTTTNATTQDILIDTVNEALILHDSRTCLHLSDSSLLHFPIQHIDESLSIGYFLTAAQTDEVLYSFLQRMDEEKFNKFFTAASKLKHLSPLHIKIATIERLVYLFANNPLDIARHLLTVYGALVLHVLDTTRSSVPNISFLKTKERKLIRKYKRMTICCFATETMTSFEEVEEIQPLEIAQHATLHVVEWQHAVVTVCETQSAVLIPNPVSVEEVASSTVDSSLGLTEQTCAQGFENTSETNFEDADAPVENTRCERTLLRSPYRGRRSIWNPPRYISLHVSEALVVGIVISSLHLILALMAFLFLITRKLFASLLFTR